MTRPPTLVRGLALAGVVTLSLAACGSDGGGDSASEASASAEASASEGSASASPSGESSPAAQNTSDGTLTIGTLLPETGSLAFLGPPEIAGASLAVQEINEAGGVLDSEAQLVEGDSGDTESGIAPQTVDRLLSSNVDAIIGAASSSVSLSVIDKIIGAGVVQFSPANTSDQFTEYDDEDLYFRTAPPDTQQGAVLAQYIAEQGVTSLGILALQDAYGEGLADTVEEQFTAAGGEVTNKIIYDPKAASYDAEVDQVAGSNPDGIVVIGFDESQKVLNSMIEKGVGPQDIQVFGVDGNIGGLGGLFEANPEVLTGMTGTQPEADLSQDFLDRLGTVDPNLDTNAYAGETYDAVIVTALAAAVAGDDSGRALAAEINGVTKEGEKCTSFSQCKELVDAGTDIDYDGVSGPLEFTDAGEPARASFAIYSYTGSQDYEVAAYRFPE